MNEKIKDKNEASLSGSANSVSQEGDQSAEPAEKESVLRNKKLPTLLGLFLLVVTILTLSIIRRNANLSSKAENDFSPREVKITNVTDRSFSISWKTQGITTGFIKLWKGSSEKFVYDIRDSEKDRGDVELHYILAENLSADTEYQFLIYSGGVIYGKSGKGNEKYALRTAKLFSGSLSQSELAFGKVVDENKIVQEGVLVYLNIPGIAPLSSITSSSGNWIVPLAFAFDQSLSTPADYKEGEIIEEIKADGGTLGNGEVINYTINNKPVADIILGKNQDFTNMLSLPPTGTSEDNKRGFGAGDVSPGATKEFKVLNPEEGEILQTSQPEIFGTGPESGKVEIIVESSDRYTGDLSIGKSGDWRWPLPGELDPGEHTLTVNFTDSTGKKESYVRKFTVLAASDDGGLGFTASPSGGRATATPKPTVTKAPSPTSTVAPTTKATATLAPTSSQPVVPTTGVLTPILFSLAAGILLIALGVVF